MTTLSSPEQSVAEQLTTEVAFEDRFHGLKMHGLKGNSEVGLYSPAEVAQFMSMDPVEDLQQYGSKGSIHYVDLDELATWLREHYDDEELAEAVEAEAQAHDNYRERVGPVRDLLQARLEQIEEE